jgi:uncharacterized SAM-binding protein YcdF (DUF218 family)
LFVFLSKFLPPFLYPLGLACLLLALGLAFSGRPQTLRTLALASLLILLLGGNRYVALGLARSLEWRYLPPQDLPAGGAIVVLGGATEPALYPRPGVEVNSAADRVLHAARLYRQGKASLIIASGGSIDWMEPSGASPAGEMASLLAELGVPPEAIVQEDRSRNTYENALLSARLLQERGVSQVILVTSALHMPRSVGVFERQGLAVLPAPADYVVTQSDWQALWRGEPAALLVNLLPGAGNLALTSSALKEYLGMLVYSLRGWM